MKHSEKSIDETISIISRVLSAGFNIRVAAEVALIDPCDEYSIANCLEEYAEYNDDGNLAKLIVNIYILNIKDNLIIPDGARWRIDDGNGIWDEDWRLDKNDIIDNIDWDEIRSSETVWVNLNGSLPTVSFYGFVDHLEFSEKITVHPKAPPCRDVFKHDWRSPYEVVGGIEENPGVKGNAGGVIMKRVCKNCGKYKIKNTWDYDPEDGIQGLTSICYEDADDTSLEWIDDEVQ